VTPATSPHAANAAKPGSVTGDFITIGRHAPTVFIGRNQPFQPFGNPGQVFVQFFLGFFAGH
jgi:hypothetical protein